MQLKRTLIPPSVEYKEKTKKRIIKNSIIDDITGCWNWVKCKTGGYGNIGYNKFVFLAHRVSYALFIGTFDESLLVCHKCDNPACVNPDHLFIGTQGDNMRDCISKKRFNRQNDIRKGEKNSGFKISDAQIMEIFNKITTGLSQTKIAKEYGIGDSSVSRIKRGYRLPKAEAP